MLCDDIREEMKKWRVSGQSLADTSGLSNATISRQLNGLDSLTIPVSRAARKLIADAKAEALEEALELVNEMRGVGA